MQGTGERDTRRQAALFEHWRRPRRSRSRGRSRGWSSTGRWTRSSRTGFPPGLRAKVVPGQRVRVPLGRGNTPSVGYCVRVDEAAEVDPARVKDVIEVLDDPPLIDGAMLDLTRWIAGVLRLHLGPGARRGGPGGGEEAGGDPGLDVPDRPRGDPGGTARRVAQAEPEAGRGRRGRGAGRTSR